MCNEKKGGAALTVVALAMALHEAAREAVEKNCVVRRDVPNKGFIEWADLDDAAREGRMISAAYLLERYAILPVENTAACSVCRTLTDALNGLDEARHEVVALRDKLAPEPVLAQAACCCAGKNCGDTTAPTAGGRTPDELRALVRQFRSAAMGLATVDTEEELRAIITLVPGVAALSGNPGGADPVVTLLSLVINTKGV